MSPTSPQPLLGRRVVVTRAREQAEELAAPLRALGAEVILMPATRIERLDDAPLRFALAQADGYDWLVFTSANAVRITCDTLRGMGRDVRALFGTKIAVVGRATARAVEAAGLAADLVPSRFVAEGVLEALDRGISVAGARVLYPAAEGARDILPAGLEARGAIVDVIPIYRSVPDGEGAEALRTRLLAQDVAWVTFTAGSAVRAFVAAVGNDAARQAPAVSIGPQTSAAVREAGLTLAAEADPSTVDGLVQAVASLAR